MRLTPQQKANIVKLYQRWQQQTAAAQHRSAHILPGMSVLQNRSLVEMTFLDRKRVSLQRSSAMWCLPAETHLLCLFTSLGWRIKACRLT